MAVGSCAGLRTWLLLVCMSAGATAWVYSQPSQGIDDGRPWLAREQATATALMRGAAAVALNRPDAESLLQGVIKTAPRSDGASDAYLLLSRLYLRAGRFAQAVANLDRWSRAFPGRQAVAAERKDIEQFRGLPDQINGVRQGARLPHDPGTDASIPVSINGKPASYLLDTGAWISVMSAREATRYGLTVRPAGTLSDSSGRGASIRTAVVNDITIGGIRLRQVSFAIVPDEGPWKSLPPGEGGLLGISVVMALGRVHWSNGGFWEVGGRSDPPAASARNIVFSGNHLLLAAGVAGRRVFGTVDTGAITTDLNATFAEAFPDLIAKGKRERHDITGLGGTASFDGVTLPEVRFDVAGVVAPLRPAAVTLQRTGGMGGDCCIGNFGRDLLMTTGTVTLDLTAMTLRLR
jgi:predicted aspartyl protease